MERTNVKTYRMELSYRLSPTVYLGCIPIGGQILPWLGSLEMLKNGNRFLGILEWIEDGLGASAKISVSGTEAGFKIPPEFDVLIMNPPYARATGRTNKYQEETTSFFGFIADIQTREIVKKSYDQVRETVRRDLINIALRDQVFLPEFAKRIVNKQDKDLEQDTGIG